MRQTCTAKGHLRWDSLGEFLALAVLLEDLAEKTDNAKLSVLAKTLDQATSRFLTNNKSPSRKVNELDTRGSHFYLALYWAQALAEQTENEQLQAMLQERLSTSPVPGMQQRLYLSRQGCCCWCWLAVARVRA